MNYDMRKSGERIQQLRIQHGYSQEKVAKLLNIDRSYVSRIESGNNGCLVDLLIQLSKLFDVSLDYIFLGQEKYNTSMSGNRIDLKADVENLIEHLEQFKLRVQINCA